MPKRIDICRVNERDAGVERCFGNGGSGGLVQASHDLPGTFATECHRSEAQLRYKETGLAENAVFHYTNSRSVGNAKNHKGHHVAGVSGT